MVVVAAVFAAVLLVATTGCADDGRTDPPGAQPDSADSDDTSAGIRVTRVASFGELLTSMVADPDGEELLVGGRSGRVWRVRLDADAEGDGEAATPVLDDELVLDLSGEVTTEFDRGFLNMVLVDEGRSLVVMYTGAEGALILAQYPYRPGEGLDLGARRVLLDFPFPFPFHHGGGLAVDRDGNLLVGLGDEGLSLPGLPGPQDPTLMLGGVMSIPAETLRRTDDAFVPTADLMVARGLRNPWRISVDPDDGDVWIGDVGNLLAEEVDLIPGADLGRSVVNFGHPYYEGSVVKAVHIPDTPFVAAALERRREEGVCGMVGGHEYRGSLLGVLKGRYVYSDLCQPEIRSFVLDGGRATDDRSDVELPEPVISIGEGASGELYGLGSGGGLFRLDPPSWRVEDNDQSPATPMPASTIPAGDKVYCGIMEAIEPFDYLGGVTPEKLRDGMATANSQLAERAPGVPADARPHVEVIQRVFRDLDRELEKVGWNTEAPELAGLRTDLLTASGIFTGFPEALSALFDSECA